MLLSKPALFLSVLLAVSPNTSPFTQALPADVKPTISRRSSPSGCDISVFKFPDCLTVGQLPPAQFTLTQDKCKSLTDSTSIVEETGNLSGVAAADGLVIGRANCTVNVYTGLLCRGSSIGTIPVATIRKCYQFNILPTLPLGGDPSNPFNFPGANSAKLTCP